MTWLCNEYIKITCQHGLNSYVHFTLGLLYLFQLLIHFFLIRASVDPVKVIQAPGCSQVDHAYPIH